MDTGDGKVAWPAENERARSLQELKGKEEWGLQGPWLPGKAGLAKMLTRTHAGGGRCLLSLIQV